MNFRTLTIQITTLLVTEAVLFILASTVRWSARWLFLACFSLLGGRLPRHSPIVPTERMVSVGAASQLP